MFGRCAPCFCLFLLFVFWPFGLQADTIILRSGEKIEGQILSETPTEVTIEIKVSASITDQKSVPKSEIEKVEKATPDEIAYQPLKAFKPGTVSRPAGQYEAIIQALRNYQKDFPQSPHAKEVKADLEAFEAEKARVDAGEFRLGANWLSKEEAAKQRYQISAMLAFSAMKEAAQRDIIGALNAFDQIEKTYPGARVFPDAIDLARRLLGPFGADVDRRLQALKIEGDKFKQGVELLPEPQKSQTLAAVKREQAQFDTILADAQKKAAKWKPFIPRSDKSLLALKTLIASETTRLATLPVAQMRSSIEQVDKARAALEAKDAITAEPLLASAKTLWSANEAVAALQLELKELKAELTRIAAAKAADEAAKAALSGRDGGEGKGAGADSESDGGRVRSFLFSLQGALVLIGVAVLVVGAVSLAERAKRRRMRAHDQ